jgi:hypothetical protein
LGVAGFSAESRTEHLPSADIEPYRYTELLSPANNYSCLEQEFCVGTVKLCPIKFVKITNKAFGKYIYVAHSKLKYACSRVSFAIIPTGPVSPIF